MRASQQAGTASPTPQHTHTQNHTAHPPHHHCRGAPLVQPAQGSSGTAIVRGATRLSAPYMRPSAATVAALRAGPVHTEAGSPTGQPDRQSKAATGQSVGGQVGGWAGGSHLEWIVGGIAARRCAAPRISLVVPPPPTPTHPPTHPHLPTQTHPPTLSTALFRDDVFSVLRSPFSLSSSHAFHAFPMHSGGSNTKAGETTGYRQTGPGREVMRSQAIGGPWAWACMHASIIQVLTA